MLQARTRTIAAFALALTFSGGCVATTEDDDATDGASAIIGGAADTGHPSVAFLRSVMKLTETGGVDEIQSCTATVIAPGVLLTAAHCLQENALWVDVNFDRQPNRAAVDGEGWHRATIVPHPEYRWATHATEGNDVGVVLCPSVDGRTPVAMRRGPTPAIGATIVAVGYGRATFAKTDSDGRGEKRSVALPLVGLTPHEIVGGKEGLGTCSGDSGGPILFNGSLVGVVSYGKKDCRSTSHFMRLDDNLDFLRKYAPSF